MLENSVRNPIDAIREPGAGEKDPKDLSLEQLVLLINTQRLSQIHGKTETQLKELKARQGKVAKLQQVLRAVNKATNEKGELDTGENEELKELLREANDLGAEVQEGDDSEKTLFQREEKERLVENIRMTIEDYRTENEMQLQSISRLTNERYESYQMARSIMRPLHEAKRSIARGARGQ